MLPIFCRYKKLGHRYVVEKVENYYRSLGDESNKWKSLKIIARCDECGKRVIIYDWHNDNLKRCR